MESAGQQEGRRLKEERRQRILEDGNVRMEKKEVEVVREEVDAEGSGRESRQRKVDQGGR